MWCVPSHAPSHTRNLTFLTLVALTLPQCLPHLVNALGVGVSPFLTTTLTALSTNSLALTSKQDSNSRACNRE